MSSNVMRVIGRAVLPILLVAAVVASVRPVSAAQETPAAGQATTVSHEAGGEASLIVPDLSTVDFRGINGRTLLLGGLVVCVLGLLFGLTVFTQLKNLP